MQHLWSKAVDSLCLSIGSLLDQAVYHPCDAFLVFKVKRLHTFAISSGASTFDLQTMNVHN